MKRAGACTDRCTLQQCFEPVRKEVKGYVVDPLGKTHFDNVLSKNK